MHRLFFYLGRFLGMVLIAFYQFILKSHFLFGHCRFEPTCSCYAREVIYEKGLLKGGLLAMRRILSCHPWG